MDAKKSLDLCRELETTANSGRLSPDQRKKIMRNALKLKLDSLSALKQKTVERCEGRDGDRSKFYYFAAYSKACKILETI